MKYNNEGFSLAEIIVAIAILAIGITSIMALFPVGLNLKKESLDNSKASAFAQQKFAEILLESRSIYTAVTTPVNSLTGEATNEYPAAGGPTPFTEDPRYFWYYKVTPFEVGATSINFIYRVDLSIYNIEGEATDTPIETFTSFMSKEG